jgi:hypothetical protein
VPSLIDRCYDSTAGAESVKGGVGDGYIYPLTDIFIQTERDRERYMNHFLMNNEAEEVIAPYES